MEVIGLGGGSGVGKTTVCDALAAERPEEFTVIHLDDYQFSLSEDLPRIGTMINWEHPDVVRWDALRQDVAALHNGQAIELHPRVRGKQPASQLQDQPKRILHPLPFLIIEGHLALHTTIANIYDITFYLDADATTRAVRRREARGGKDTLSGNDQYAEQVLRPMHANYIEPTKRHADVIIDAQAHTTTTIAKIILQHLQNTS